ncbi:Mob1/phocein [Alternaria rosae]|uniref:Mob1/phocein n=1 Tax=Alternaria rosae TaxID=1187941 RepID=UPI001E8E6F98|nr:Mob1/phocein [Alternaria rosae]KAH6857225.1 Mob1/phocein [Alternaria rosae]
MTSPASPRLPSPPPIPEDQLSPVSASPEQQKLFSNLDHAAERRIRPGTKAEDMAEGPPLVDLSEIDSAFQLTEHLKALHNSLTHPAGSNGTVPVDRNMALKIAQSPANVDRTLWLYELCRFLIQKVNSIITALFADDPPCSSLTCPEMRASEWQYLCAVHDPPKSCCAIDYCCHTLDWAANTLTSPKHFPSRLALGTDSSTQHSQMRQLTNIFRRVYRIFAHAWYSHREVFWKVEGRTGLYIFYKTVCDVYGLVPEDNYTIPPEAEGIEPSTEVKPSAPPLIMKREPSDSTSEISSNTLADGMSDHSLSTAGTTKRHRHSPSVGATAVQTVVEENEEEEDRPVLQARPVTQIFESAQEDEEEEEGDSDGDVTAIEDNNEEDDDDEDDDEDEDEDEAEAAEEITQADAKDPTTEAAKEDGGEEKAAGTSHEEEEKKDDDAATESATADTAEASAPDVQDGGKEPSQDVTEAKEDSKPDAEGSEETKKVDSAAESADEEGGAKAQD